MEPVTLPDGSVSVLKEVFELNKGKDPEEDQQAALIEAKRLLLSVEQNIFAQNNDEKFLLPLAAIQLLIGKSSMDSNDYGEAEKYFNSCLDSLPKQETYCVDSWGIRVECHVYFGVALSKLCKVDASLCHLEKAKHLFDVSESEIEDNPPMTAEGILIGTEAELLQDYRRQAIEQLRTHCLYFLAQAHLQFGNKKEATLYCQQTLFRQLKFENNFDAHDWAINCASLAQVFLEERNYKAAVHYLSCALSMEDKIRETKVEEYSEFHATMHRCISSLGVRLLEDYVESKTNGVAETDTLDGNGINGHTDDFLRQTELSKLHVDIEKVESMLPSQPPETYEEARETFLVTQRSLLEARDTFYHLDTHCNDYIEITQSYSKIFKLMASLEPDHSRRVAMHRRRVDMLTNLIERLNPQFYLLYYRQLVYELAETYHKMIDTELAIIEQKRSKSVSSLKHEEKANAWIDAAISWFNKYIDSLRQPFGDVSKPIPDPLSEGDVRPVLCAYLSMGRLQSKKFADETHDRIAHLLKSELFYKEIKAYCDRHPDAISLVQAEYNATVELLNLMPVKLEAVRQGQF